jgi:2-keto-4-pentenoate hydratase/2-oxohepta-3-ene-1,7-dioic acid hydratase in catechol pathway
VKLARFRVDDGPVRCGLVDQDSLIPVGDGVQIVELAMRRRLLSAAGSPVPIADATILTPVPDPRSIRDFYAFEEHVKTAREARGLEMDPDWYELPVFYFSNPAAVLGPDDEVAMPPGTEALDYELEVAAVIGHEAVGEEAGPECIAGFTIMNDWSARDLQRREMGQGLGPSKGKDFATSLGPWLVTPDELPGWKEGRPGGAMVARVNDEEWSRGDLGSLHHSWEAIVSHAARGTRLRPGDVLGSGTVGTGCILELSLVHGSEKYPWLQPGDRVELEVEGLGVLANTVVAGS